MSSSHKKPAMAFWATVVVVMLLVAYPLSFGPACWWFTSSPVAKPFPGEPLLRIEPELRGTSARYAPLFYWPRLAGRPRSCADLGGHPALCYAVWQHNRPAFDPRRQLFPGPLALRGVVARCSEV